MRRKPPERLAAIADAAITVFTRLGYRRAQMADIAAELGLSVGSLYSYASGKEALAQLALLRLLDFDPAGLALPHQTNAESERAILRALAERTRWPLLEAATARFAAPADVAAELGAIIGELFDALLASRRLIRFLDACVLHMPAIAAQFLGQSKGAYLELLERYLTRRQRQGKLARLGPKPAGDTRALLEQVAWLALHRQADALPPPLDDAEARATAQAFAVAAFAATAFRP